MERKNTYIVAAVVALAILGVGFVYFKGATIDPEVTDDATLNWENKPAVKDDMLAPQEKIISAKHAFIKNKHIVVGEVQLPNPCMILESGATVDTDKKSALIDLIATQKTDEICAQVVTSARFKVEFEADKDAKINIRYNGQPATLNLIEAKPGEDLEKAELYIKG